MTAHKRFLDKLPWQLLAFLCLMPALRLSGDTRSVDCDAGNTIQGALKLSKPGDTLLLSGACAEHVEITEQWDGLILDGQGTATISGPDSSQDTLRLVGLREATVKGLRIKGGRDGIHTRWVTRVFVLAVFIEQTGRNGIQTTRNSYVHMPIVLFRTTRETASRFRTVRCALGPHWTNPRNTESEHDSGQQRPRNRDLSRLGCPYSWEHDPEQPAKRNKCRETVPSGCRI